MPKFEIKYRWNNEVKLTIEGKDRNAAIKQAIKDKKDLSGSNLSGSDLRDSDLRGSNLRDSDLSGSNLSGSDLRGSNLSGSNLSGSDLRDSDLSGSDLRGSNLSGSNLSGSDLSDIKNDFWDVLLRATGEVQGLKDALLAGLIDGSQYEGACACLIGTIANLKECNYESIPNLQPNSSRPSEIFFLNIKKGDTPETNQVSRIVCGWIDEFMSFLPEIYGVKK